MKRKSNRYRAFTSQAIVVYETVEVGLVTSLSVALGEGLALGLLALHDHYTGTDYTISFVNFVKDQILNNVIPKMMPKITDSVTASLLAIISSSGGAGLFGSWGYAQVKACCFDPRRQGYYPLPQDDSSQPLSNGSHV